MTKRIWTGKWQVAGIVWGTIVLGAQMLPLGEPTNPRSDDSHSIDAAAPVPQAIAATLRRACGNCHSNDTQWPWYAQVAPVKWAMVADVEGARKAMNFSEWTTGAGRTPAVAMATLAAACADVRSERMPPAKYRLLHPEAKLSADETSAICAWTAHEMTRLKPVRRPRG